MAFIYDRKDDTVIVYNPLDRIRFLAGVPEREDGRDGGEAVPALWEKVAKGDLFEHDPDVYFKSVERRQARR